MAIRLELFSKIEDPRAIKRKREISDLGFDKKIKDVFLADVYTIDCPLNPSQFQTITTQLVNPLTQSFLTRTEKTKTHFSKKFTFVIEVGFLPGVTDNIGHTAKEIIEDALKLKFTDQESVYASLATFIDGNLSEKDALQIANTLYNPLIQRVHIKTYQQFKKDGGMDVTVPKVRMSHKPKVREVNLNVSDVELTEIGKKGIKNVDGTPRGPLALDLIFMKTIQNHFKKLGRNPTDIELESISQTWSEHCKHTIFADPIDDIKDGLYKTYIKGATKKIRSQKGKKDFCVSVFTDNSGAIVFDDNYLITHKVETHNSPSALDPFGGAITGIVGVNRDTIGFGLGAKPIANFYGFCLSDPRVDITLYKDGKKTQKMLSSRRIMDGVIAGVNAGGNQSGIPTPQGFIYFDERYRGKPLVFVGTVGLIPKKIKGKLSHIKKAQPGDLIVMVGGRVGKDGIHGATFSSESLNSGSPVGAVQIGDPITQKKLSDAIIKEARDLLLYNSITDNGAGGLSCSVSEMAKESGGCLVDLEKVPLKYPGLDPWEIWISESQERMTLAVPIKNWKRLQKIMNRHGVQTTIIGTFTKSGKCQVSYNRKIIMDMDMKFLHDGLPARSMKTSGYKVKNAESKVPQIRDLSKSLITILGRLNIASFEFISQQYDHIVQGAYVLGPLLGRGRVNADATVIRPLLNSQKGVVMSQGLYPSLSDIDSYHMSACSIDTAIRNAVAVGANPKYLALLDNFCWCSSNDQKRLKQLKDAAIACYDYAVAFGTPYISGKDSMFNDFKGFDKNGSPIEISIPPTLLISSFGVIDDFKKTVSLDAKIPGDIIYILGETKEELGGSEYLAMNNFTSKNIPTVNALKNKKLYETFYNAVQKKLIASSISIGRGGLGVALAKKAIGGKLGVDISLKNIPGKISRDDYALYSETQGRILISIAPNNKKAFEKIMIGNKFGEIGRVTEKTSIKINGLKGQEIIRLDLEKATESYRKTFKDY